MAARNPFTVYEVRKATWHMLSALAHLHGLGIVHNDLQCKNIWVTQSGHGVVLGDFDRSQIAEETPAGGAERRFRWTDEQAKIMAKDIRKVGSNVM